MTLGTKIRNIRCNNKYSQEDMARILKVNRNYLSRIETSKSSPTPEVLVRIAEAFDISLDSLLGVNQNNADEERRRNEKIKKISNYCTYLSNQELDFVSNMLCVMSNNSKKDSIKD